MADWLRPDLVLLFCALSVCAVGLVLMTVWSVRAIVTAIVDIWSALLNGAAEDIR